MKLNECVMLVCNFISSKAVELTDAGCQCEYIDKFTMTPTWLTLLIGTILTVRCHSLKCYNCDSEHDDACAIIPRIKNATCAAKEFCAKVHYKMLEGRSSTLCNVTTAQRYYWPA